MHKIISQYFDEYSTMSEVSYNSVLQISENEGIEMNQIIIATSFCFDELNHQPAKMNLPSSQGTFIMGGLAGYPFVGDIGLTAFSDHIPDGGAALFIFGSHIGISRSGEIGKIKRVGQHRHTNTCGALMMVQDHVLSTTIHHIDPADYSEFQPEFLALRLLPLAEEIRNSSVPILKTTHLVYDEIEKEIIKLITNHPSSLNKFPVYILGGIVINTDETLPNYFSQKVFRKIF
ncbi:MAG TPA: hypothetical protein DCL77_02755 [Prolixibacteraceae bacterium]|jgi:hypothetical protein|nr:hypothetical protein [Prolixibacteraceae bacterium]